MTDGGSLAKDVTHETDTDHQIALQWAINKQHPMFTHDEGSSGGNDLYEDAIQNAITTKPGVESRLRLGTDTSAVDTKTIVQGLPTEVERALAIGLPSEVQGPRTTSTEVRGGEVMYQQYAERVVQEGKSRDVDAPDDAPINSGPEKKERRENDMVMHEIDLNLTNIEIVYLNQ